MTLYFITGNKDKFVEARSVLPEIEQLDVEIPEIQDIDAKKIIKEKLLAAFLQKSGEFVVEDTSLYLDCLNGLPGPLIKWFMKTIGNDGLSKIATLFGNDRAQAKSIIGYAKSKDEVSFFEGIISGRIVDARGNLGWGWDPVFLPDGCEKTFGEMNSAEKNQLSMRRIVFDQLKDFLSKAG